MKKSRALSIEQMKYIIRKLIEVSDYRMATLVYLNSRPMRIHDILDLKVADVFDPEGKPRAEIFIKEQKTGHNRTLLIWTSEESEIYKTLSMFFSISLEARKRSDQLFISEKRKSNLTQSGVYFILNKFVGQMEIEQISSHSIRKTTGKFLHAQGYDIETIASIYNHDDIRSTRTYLDITQKEVRRAQEAICW